MRVNAFLMMRGLVFVNPNKQNPHGRPSEGVSWFCIYRAATLLDAVCAHPEQHRRSHYGPRDPL